MSVINQTPFTAIAFRQYDLAGRMMGVVSVRGTFNLVEDGPLALAQNQAPLLPADEYAGDPHETDMIAQSSLVPFKPGTDVTFVGAAYAPNEIPRASWTCGLTVGPVSKSLRVFGNRHWEAVRKPEGKGRPKQSQRGRREGWVMGEAEPAQYVVLSWNKAFGGSDPSGLDEKEAYPTNPIGRGIVSESAPEAVQRIPAPQIEDPDQPITDWRKKYEPQNIAPIPPFWPQRHQYAGTYDDAWLKHRYPMLPEDFDFRFWQCAHPDLVTQQWLKGDEPFELRKLIYQYPVVRGALPGIRLQMQLPRDGGTGVADFVLDGVHFDMRPDVGSVFLTWRAGFPWPDGKGVPEIVSHDPLPEAV